MKYMGVNKYISMNHAVLAYWPIIMHAQIFKHYPNDQASGQFKHYPNDQALHAYGRDEISGRKSPILLSVSGCHSLRSQHPSTAFTIFIATRAGFGTERLGFSQTFPQDAEGLG
jgi:hypothetical protein